MPFRLRTNTPGGKTTEKKNNYSINKFTSCIEDDNSTFQREELIVVLLIIHHDAPIRMYTKADECVERTDLEPRRKIENERETQRQGPISQPRVCHDFTNTSAITLN